VSSTNSVGFNAGGIDVSAIVSGLMGAERLPGEKMRSRQAEVKLKSDAMGRLRNSLESLRTAAGGLVTKGVNRLSSSVSNASAVSATVGATAAASTASFTVDQLAVSHSARTATPVASATSVVTTSARLAVSNTAARLGVSSAAFDDGVTAGKYTLEVTQASAAARRTGSAVAASTVVSAANNSLSLSVNGTTINATIAAGAYTRDQLATALQTAIGQTAIGPSATVSVDAASGSLSIATAREGSAASLQVLGGSALSALGMSADAVAATGTDGKFRVGTGAEVTVTSTGGGGTYSAAATGGNLSISVDSGLRVGTATVAAVDTGDRSLAAVAAAVNTAGAGVSAGAVKQSDSSWFLQLASSASGTNGTLTIGGAGLQLSTLSAAQDAKITLGSGANALSVSSSTNTFSDVMPGTSLTVQATTTTPVTVSVSRDENATADAVQALLTSANAVIGEVQMQTKFDPTTKKGSPLTGNATVRGLIEKVRSAVNDAVSGAAYASAGGVGITTARDGTLNFDRTVFLNALRSNTADVERVFGRGGTSTGIAQFATATDATVPGSYNVDVTTAPTKARVTNLLAGLPNTARVVGVRMGSVVATANIPANATPDAVASALSTSMASAGLNLTAGVTGGAVTVTANAFGTAGNFDVNLDVSGSGTWSASTGVDVQGTIDGQAAVGLGQTLSLSTTSTSNAKGLAVNITEGQTGSALPVAYAPGIAARLMSTITALTATAGEFTSSLASYDKQYADFTTKIDKFDERMITKEDMLRRQWSRVQASLAGLQSQQTWLKNQTAAMNNSNS
jgi:flagellar hook-associated protein 2